MLITDGLKAYNDACKFEYWTPKMETRTVHIRHISLKGEHHNNMIERLNGQIRDRQKVIRGLKKPDTPILAGYQIYHNYVRPHMGLEGRTPAEAAGIKVEGTDKWLTLIQNASKNLRLKQNVSSRWNTSMPRYYGPGSKALSLGVIIFLFGALFSCSHHPNLADRQISRKLGLALNILALIPVAYSVVVFTVKEMKEKEGLAVRFRSIQWGLVITYIVLITTILVFVVATPSGAPCTT